LPELQPAHHSSIQGRFASGKKEPSVSEESTNNEAAALGLTQQEIKQLEDLKNRDQEVRKHEQAHKSAGGRYAEGVSFSYQTGPDGRRYAVGGEVGIDVSKEDTPEETIQKAASVRAAALAPANPSSQDRKIAAMASQMAQEARHEVETETERQNPDGSISTDQKETNDRLTPIDKNENAPDVPGAEQQNLVFGSLAVPKTSILEKSYNADYEFKKWNDTFIQNATVVTKAYHELVPAFPTPGDGVAVSILTLNTSI
jgi:hypothetical protein